tara:strand:- start:71 stop:706 length:636 start_codon:yes stop_codon:yes gene_type:complete
MSIRVDNSYMYKYLEEQHQRDTARTASDKAESRRKEIPYVIAKYGGIAVIILSIGLAVYFGNSYKQISEKTNVTQAYEQASKNQYIAENDELIDVDTLLNEIETESSFPINNPEPIIEQSSVRNYVIFDRIEFQYGGIQKVTIGRQYDDPDSEVNSSWCYVDKLNSEGFKNTLYLVSIHDEREELKITNEIAESFGVSKTILEEAQQLCTI